jgi:hypothetical protein
MSDLPEKTDLDDTVPVSTVPLSCDHILIPGTPFKPYEGKETPDVSIFNDNDRALSAGNHTRYAAGLGEESRDWLSSIKAAENLKVSNGLFIERLEKGNWAPYINRNGEKISSSSDSIKFESNGGVVSGEKAVLRLQQLRGNGQNRTFPLHRSGLWFRIRPIGDDALADMQTEVLNERTKLGRMSTGLALSATTTYMIKHLIRLVLSNISDTNVKDNDLEKVFKLLRLSDVMPMAAYAAQTLFPKGFPLSRPCTINPAKCENVDKQIFMPAYLVLHDDERMTPNQKAFMATGIEHKRTYEAIKAHQDSFEENFVFPISDIETLVLGDPTVEEFIDDAEFWIDGIVATVDKLLDEDYDDAKRDHEIQVRARQTTLRQYSSYVRCIRYMEEDGEERVIKDRETLNSAISGIVGDDESSAKFVAAVRHVQSETPITITGVPRYNCPVCEPAMTDAQKLHPFYTPVDAIQLFFTLQRSRLAKMHRKSLNAL